MATQFSGQKFCQECNNMLYADESMDEKMLAFKCKICSYQEIAEKGNEYENCVYKTDLEEKETQLIINPDIVDDPTLTQRFIDNCLNPSGRCTNKEVVSFLHIGIEKFDLIYVCTKCKFHWRHVADGDESEDEDDM
uniref:DNA-directed RNA polymerase II subunit RPB9-like zinc ribbon domain-containing protein n=1 Tax=Strombidium rassoulzadegani TaxID=1082188 RepID=A0A7S3CIP9_9SPIT|mmetsp:Transcript_11444/g.19352  ORF Transcript_11444/g.19352 Transcript_11444/m.19352 type:complete len:136 (+) Transcript_11444:49-456(+)